MKSSVPDAVPLSPGIYVPDAPPSRRPRRLGREQCGPATCWLHGGPCPQTQCGGHVAYCRRSWPPDSSAVTALSDLHSGDRRCRQQICSHGGADSPVKLAPVTQRQRSSRAIEWPYAVDVRWAARARARDPQFARRLTFDGPSRPWVTEASEVSDTRMQTAHGLHGMPCRRSCRCTSR